LFLVNLSKTWPKVLKGKRTPADVTLSAWAQIKDADLDAHADAILGIYKNAVVTAFDIDGWTRSEDKRVTFTGQPSQQWAHLVGLPTPGKPWVPGQGRPVQVIPTAVLTEGEVPVADTPAGRRAVIDGYVLAVQGAMATLQVPAGGKVTVSLLPA